MGKLPGNPKRAAAAHPGRTGSPRNAARLIGFLASDKAQWITGQIIHSEGRFCRWFFKQNSAVLPPILV
ncbi:hypothetical protein FQV30_09235 [Planomicrobium sp. CPCC 101110]|nr:hypothetical protein FQV30_09235 [Planomicrobium sp. CPCC 101110]